MASEEAKRRQEARKKEIYTDHFFRMRKIEDKELLEDLDKAVSEGMTKREWLRRCYYLKPEIPTDLCSIREVEQLMMTYKIPYVTRMNIINALKKK